MDCSVEANFHFAHDKNRHHNTKKHQSNNISEPNEYFRDSSKHITATTAFVCPSGAASNVFGTKDRALLRRSGGAFGGPLPVQRERCLAICNKNEDLRGEWVTNKVGRD